MYFYNNEVIIRTNGESIQLTIDAENDTVYHYGYARLVDIIAVDTNCYYEVGTSSTITAKKGTVVIKENGTVFNLKKSSGSTATFKNEGGNVLKAEAETLEKNSINSTIFNINNLDQLLSFRDATNSNVTFKDITINLNCDIHLEEAWIPASNYYRESDNIEKAFAGTFNGNGHTIYNLTNVNISEKNVNKGYNSSTPENEKEIVYGFFALVNGATITNINFKEVNIVDFDNLLGDCVGTVVGASRGITKLTNIKVLSGVVSGYDSVGGIVGQCRGTSIEIDNCENYAIIKSYRRAAGIAGQLGVLSENSKIKDCKNYGSITCNANLDGSIADNTSWYYACGIACINDVTNIIFTFDNCLNDNKVTIVNNGYANNAYKISNIQTNGNKGVVYTNGTSND